MIQSRSSAQTAAPFLHRTQPDRAPVRRLIGLAGVMSIAVCIAILLRQEAAALILGIFALFAALGVAALFASAAGF
jgi:hypothetical protein